MKTQNALLALIASTATFGLAACGDAPRTIPITNNVGGGGGGGMGAGGGAGAPAAMGTPLLIEGETGDYVSGMSNEFGIQGSFFKYSDCDALNSDGIDDPEVFMANGFTCTENWTLNTATPGSVCISGTIGVREDTTDYTDWGAGMGFNLNESIPEVEGENGVPNPFDAMAHGILGFSFTITGTGLPTNTVVEMSTPAIMDDGTHSARVMMGVNNILFADLAQPGWAMMLPFDPTTITALKWKAESVAGSAAVVDFCVSNVTPIQ